MFNEAEFWKARLGEGGVNLQSVGYRSLGSTFNKWMYRVRHHLMQREMARLPIGQRVLDVGCGTGFYIDLWAASGRVPDGIDISPASIEALRGKYPAYTFVCGNITEESLLLASAYDAISAFDVLFHLVDDKEYADALKNINSHLKPGGYFLYTENLPVSRVSYKHQVSRSREEVIESLTREGFRVIREVPMFILMNRPISSRNPILQWYWRLLVGILQRFPSVGALLGPVLYVIELALLTRVKKGPSTKLLICEKV